MGLDMYAYVANKAGQQAEYYDKGDWNEELKEFVSPVAEPRELAYWRKHPNLHGWLEQLWIRKTNESGGVVSENPDWGSSFNGIELELTHEDLDELEQAVINGELPATTGFFFGNDADDHYKEQDLQFIKNARAELFCGFKVFYNSSW